MPNRIKALFKGLGKPATENPESSFPDKQLAAAALLVEAACLDGNLEGSERRTIENLLVERFSLSKQEALDLFNEALAAQAEATHLMRFTRTIKDNYSEDERIELIEMLWDVAYADGIIHEFEDNLIRRIAGLIYVSDFDRGAAKKRAAARFEEGGK